MYEIKLLIPLCLLQITDEEKVDYFQNAKQFPERLLTLIMSYNDRGASQIDDVTGIRAKYEETHQFEMGYVMSDILERYRKMVGLAQRPIAYKADTVFDAIRSTEMIQKLFLEIYHLANMFHEINAKYGREAGAADEDDEESNAMGDRMAERIREIERIRYMEKKKRLKQMKRDRQLYIKQGVVMKKKPSKPENRWWPIDYGWEVDYKWF